MNYLDSLHARRFITLEGCLNIRDLGGYAVGNTRVTRWRSVIRADNLDKLPLASQQRLLEEYKIAKIIDLRSPGETKNFPSTAWQK